MERETDGERGPFPEKRESFEVETRTLTADELEKFVYRNGRSPDARFLDPEQGGVFKYFDLSKLTERRIAGRDLYYPVAEHEGEIVGLSELERASDEESVYWMTFLSIDPQYQGKGCASRLAEELFRFAKERGDIHRIVRVFHGRMGEVEAAPEQTC